MMNNSVIVMPKRQKMQGDFYLETLFNWGTWVDKNKKGNKREFWIKKWKKLNSRKTEKTMATGTEADLLSLIHIQMCIRDRCYVFPCKSSKIRN